MLLQSKMADTLNINVNKYPGIYYYIINKTNLDQAIDEMIGLSEGKLQKSGEPGDAWIVLNYLQRLLAECK